MLGTKQGRRLMQYVPDYVVFDLETTGISPAYDAVIEISAVKVRGGRVADTFSTLVNPERRIPSGASRVNHIYDDMVADAPKFDEALAEFDAFAGDMVLVGHNIHTFDMKFIWRDAKRYWGSTFTNDYIDTLILARRCLPGLAHHRLVDLADHYHISTEGAHRALSDCGMNQKVYELLSREVVPPQAAGEAKLCPRCGQPMKLRKGRFGQFWGCCGYPNCRYTENL